jgi:hypothetical protein
MSVGAMFLLVPVAAFLPYRRVMAMMRPLRSVPATGSVPFVTGMRMTVAVRGAADVPATRVIVARVIVAAVASAYEQNREKQR